MNAFESSTQASRPSFDKVVETILRLAESHTVTEGDGPGRELEYPGWQDSRSLELEPELAEHVGLKTSVRACIVGDSETGIGFILRNSALLRITGHNACYGFFIQPEPTETGSTDFTVWEAPARWPEMGKKYWGSDLFDHKQRRKSEDTIATLLVRSLQNNIKTN